MQRTAVSAERGQRPQPNDNRAKGNRVRSPRTFLDLVSPGELHLVPSGRHVVQVVQHVQFVLLAHLQHAATHRRSLPAFPGSAGRHRASTGRRMCSSDRLCQTSSGLQLTSEASSRAMTEVCRMRRGITRAGGGISLSQEFNVCVISSNCHKPEYFSHFKRTLSFRPLP
ncbi:unnamed protein product, partial [Ixodes pacificus]